MNLTRKTILVVISTFVALIFIVGAVTDIILLKSFSNLERRAMGESILKMLVEIDEVQDDIASSTSHYSQVARDRGPQIIKQLDKSSLIDHRVDVVASFARSGGLLSYRTINFHTHDDDSMSPALLEGLKSAADSAFRSANWKTRGLFFSGETPMLFASRAIDDAHVLLSARRVDREEVARLSELTHTELEILNARQEKLPQDALEALAQLERGIDIHVSIQADDRVAGYALIKDVKDQPGLLVKLCETRLIYNQGRTSVYYIFFVLLLAGTVLCSVVLVFVRGVMLERISGLGSSVQIISESGNIRGRLNTDGEDEISSLAASINTMLESLQKAEEDLRDSEERHRLLFERAPDGILITGLEGEEDDWIIAANSAAASQHGYTVEELRELHMSEIMTPETIEATTDIINRMAAGEWLTFEAWHIHKDGSRFPLEVNAGPLMIAGRKYILRFGREISSRKFAEETDRMHLDHIRHLNDELSRKANDLASANKQLESFNYSVSHDMRAPLARMSGYCQLILDEQLVSDEQAQTYITRIYESSVWLNELIDAMLQLSRLTQSEFIPCQLDLSAIVQEVFDELRGTDPTRRVELVCSDSTPVVGDRNLLRILVTNLVGNAWKYSAKQPETRIEFGVQHDGDIPVYFIRDNGAGFDMKQAGKLFTAFTRLHGPEEFAGSGIGLATAHRVVMRHGGRIWAEGEPGTGATFYFTLQSEA